MELWFPVFFGSLFLFGSTIRRARSKFCEIQERKALPEGNKRERKMVMVLPVAYKTEQEAHREETTLLHNATLYMAK